MNGEERRDFVRNHRTAVFGFARAADGPSMSCVYYVMDGEDILVSTMAGRAKARAVPRDPKVSLCVLDENWPPTYLLVHGDATIEEAGGEDLMIRICELMAEQPMPDAERTNLIQLAREERRVVVRITPYSTFESPPRHVYGPDDVAALTHDFGASLPWDAN
jgi:PPOX class probable F420-dependent enzyme